MKQYLKDLGPKEIIENLKKGLSIECDDTSNKYFMIDGIICCLDFEGELYINSGIPCNEEEWYFKIDEPFKITEPGFYKARDGEKIYIATITPLNGCSDNEYCCFGLVEGHTVGQKWSITGECSDKMDKDRPCILDIISKWED